MCECLYYVLIRLLAINIVDHTYTYQWYVLTEGG